VRQPPMLQIADVVELNLSFCRIRDQRGVGRARENGGSPCGDSGIAVAGQGESQQGVEVTSVWATTSRRYR
jgi:hypothetical protein